MGSDSIPNSAAAAAKKKRNNRSAKLKQCKLDARREQWLSQGSVCSPPISPSTARIPRPRNCENDSKRSNEDEERFHEVVELGTQTESVGAASGGGNRRRNAVRNRSPSNSVSSGSSVDYCSRSVSDLDAEEDYEGVGEEENGVLDDWEAVADALEDDDRLNNLGHDTASSVAQSVSCPGVSSEAVGSGGTAKPQPIRTRAWTPDDAARPQSLPSILKQWSFPSNMERQYNCIQQRCNHSLPLACPICCEDLDPTDTSFLPCSCGFRLCLFCHKRILEADGRCPGCRKKYDAGLGSKASEVNTGQVPLVPFRLPRSCSMNARF